MFATSLGAPGLPVGCSVSIIAPPKAPIYEPRYERLRSILAARSACKDRGVQIPAKVRAEAGGAKFLGYGYGHAYRQGDVFLFHDGKEGRYFTVGEHNVELLRWADAKQVDVLPEHREDSDEIRNFEPGGGFVADHVIAAALKIHPDAEIDSRGRSGVSHVVRFEAPGIRFILGAVAPVLYGWEVV